MSETAHETGGTGPSHRNVEAGVAVVVAAVGLITVIGSLRVGVGWGDDGPKAGFFPFYIGLIILVSSAVNLFQLFAAENDNAVFATWRQIYKVLTVVVPTAIYVAVIPYAGIYVASALLIGLFMIWLGKYSAVVAIPTAIAVPIFFFVTFERWFLVPLPKGPIEKLLGF
ncbi:MAG: tripartite tricarboxylate transporter TctB family protein [Rhizobiales bacterium]|nr:tripartite tricarboxylate transporter TctB family protein [Hyphomicrobiales bacterium]